MAPQILQRRLSILTQEDREAISGVKGIIDEVYYLNLVCPLLRQQLLNKGQPPKYHGNTTKQEVT